MARRIVMWLVAAAGPFVVIAGGRWDLTTMDPVLAGALLVAYEAAVLVIVFAGGVADRLKGRWQDRLAARLDQRLSVWIGGVGRRYREWMLANLRFIDVKGLATVGFYQPELEEVFVDVSLAHRAPSDVPDSVLAEVPPEVPDRHSIVDFLDHATPAILAVVGVPGSGKTTLLRHTARQICRRRRHRRRTVPILLYLRDHAATIVANRDVWLPELLAGVLGPRRRDELADWLERQLSRGACVVLLDGLDEVGKQDERGKVADWVDRQVRRYPNNDFVLTSRPHGYRTTHIDGATVLQVRSFTYDQVTTFVRGWYLAVERHIAEEHSADVRLLAEAGANDLLERLSRAPSLYDLTVNPLLLTMIANVHRYRGALPGSRVRLYEEICQVMLWRRIEAKRLPMALGGDEKETLLRGLAYAMMRGRVRDLSRADVLAELGPGLRRMSTTLTEDGFLADVGSNGLLIERESGRYSFAHLTFQEYLAATHIREHGLAQSLTETVDDEWWRETTLLYVARSDADAIVEACLRSGSIAALSLAFDCADQAVQLAPELRDRLEKLLDTALTSPANSTGSSDSADARHQLMTGILVARQLREVIRTNSGARLCVNPVSIQLYRLFERATLSTMHGPLGPGDPLGPGRQLVTRDDAEPVTGVWRKDALAFVRWVNLASDGNQVYRLPNHAEVVDPAVERALTQSPSESPRSGSAWFDSGDGRVVLWAPPATTHPHQIDAATLAQHVQADVARAMPTVHRLLVLRSIFAVRVLARGIELMPVQGHPRAFERLRGLDLNLTRDLVLDIAYDVSRTLGLVVVGAGPATRTLAGAQAKARGFNNVLGGTFSAERRERAITLADKLHTELVDLFTHVSDPDNPIDRMLAVELSRAEVALAGHPARDLDQAFDRGLEALMGTVLANTIARVLRVVTSPQGMLESFTHTFVREASVPGLTYVLAPDAVVEQVAGATRAVLEQWSTDSAVADVWPAQVAERLREAGPALLGRHQPLTADASGATRLAALCLAAEATSRAVPDVSRALQEVAAGVTLLERRANGQAPTSEMIILALA